MASLDNFTDDELRALILKKQIEYIKLCQDNFLIFVRAMWPDFICRDTTDPTKFGHHQIISNEFESIASKRYCLKFAPKFGLRGLSPLLVKNQFIIFAFTALVLAYTGLNTAGADIGKPKLTAIEGLFPPGVKGAVLV